MTSRRDADIRPRLKELLKATSFLIDELGIGHGRVRIDVAAIDTDFHGFEIKAEADTLKRLPRQVRYYSKVCDFASLVVPAKHLEKATPLIPAWWGLYDAETLAVLRMPQRNPTLTPRAIAEVLWKDESLAFLASAKAGKGMSSQRVAKVWDRVARTFPLDEIRAEVRRRLVARRNEDGTYKLRA